MPSVNTPDLTAARDLLRSIFGYDDFRPYQAEIIANILACRDTLGGDADRQREVALLADTILYQQSSSRRVLR